MLPKLYYPPLLHNIGTFMSLSGPKFFQIKSALASHLLVLCTAAVRLNFLIYAGTVDILVLLVFCDEKYVLLFLSILEWRGDIFVLFIPHQI